MCSPMGKDDEADTEQKLSRFAVIYMPQFAQRRSGKLGLGSDVSAYHSQAEHH